MTENDNETDGPFAVPHRPERQRVRKTETMSENDNETDTEKMNPVALAYDDIDDELIAKLYTLEIVAECKDLWWVRVEHLD